MYVRKYQPLPKSAFCYCVSYLGAFTYKYMHTHTAVFMKRVVLMGSNYKIKQLS